MRQNASQGPSCFPDHATVPRAIPGQRDPFRQTSTADDHFLFLSSWLSPSLASPPSSRCLASIAAALLVVVPRLTMVRVPQALPLDDADHFPDPGWSPRCHLLMTLAIEVCPWQSGELRRQRRRCPFPCRLHYLIAFCHHMARCSHYGACPCALHLHIFPTMGFLRPLGPCSSYKAGVCRGHPRKWWHCFRLTRGGCQPPRSWMAQPDLSEIVPQRRVQPNLFLRLF